jgi:hypothetical protein
MYVSLGIGKPRINIRCVPDSSILFENVKN